MADLPGECDDVSLSPTPGSASAAPPLTPLASFKGPRRRGSAPKSLEFDEFINLLHGSNPVKVELNRLENEVRDKDRELGETQAEIKALKLSERQREMWKRAIGSSSGAAEHGLQVALRTYTY